MALAKTWVDFYLPMETQGQRQGLVPFCYVLCVCLRVGDLLEDPNLHSTFGKCCIIPIYM